VGQEKGGKGGGKIKKGEGKEKERGTAGKGTPQGKIKKKAQGIFGDIFDTKLRRGALRSSEKERVKTPTGKRANRSKGRKKNLIGLSRRKQNGVLD